MINDVLTRVQNGEFDYEHKPTHIATTRDSAEYLARKDTADANRKSNREAELGTRNAFRKALAETYGVTEHPKEERLWELAWSKGHSNGYSEVALEYDELVTLIQ